MLRLPEMLKSFYLLSFSCAPDMKHLSSICSVYWCLKIFHLKPKASVVVCERSTFRCSKWHNVTYCHPFLVCLLAGR